MIKLFISYSHPDGVYIETFRRFMTPLCDAIELKCGMIVILQQGMIFGHK